CSLADTIVPTGAPLLSRSEAPAFRSATVAAGAAAGFVVGAAAGGTSAIAAEAARNKTEAPPIMALNLFMIFPVSGLITLTKCQFRESIAMGRLLGSGDPSVRSALLGRGSLRPRRCVADAIVEPDPVHTIAPAACVVVAQMHTPNRRLLAFDVDE